MEDHAAVVVVALRVPAALIKLNHSHVLPAAHDTRHQRLLARVVYSEVDLRVVNQRVHQVALPLQRDPLRVAAKLVADIVKERDLLGAEHLYDIETIQLVELEGCVLLSARVEDRVAPVHPEALSQKAQSRVLIRPAFSRLQRIRDGEAVGAADIVRRRAESLDRLDIQAPCHLHMLQPLHFSYQDVQAPIPASSQPIKVLDSETTFAKFGNSLTGLTCRNCTI